MVICEGGREREMGEKRGFYVYACTPGSELTSSILLKQPLPGLLFTFLDEYTAKHRDTCPIERWCGEHSLHVLRA